MENASKALIIAGAILLAILLITLGIMVFNQASNTVTNSGMSEAELTAFNSKFVKYEGSQKGTMVKSMIQEVLANNAEGGNAARKITVNGSETINTSGINNNQTYTVGIDYTNGRVSNITYQ